MVNPSWKFFFLRHGYTPISSNVSIFEQYFDLIEKITQWIFNIGIEIEQNLFTSYFCQEVQRNQIILFFSHIKIVISYFILKKSCLHAYSRMKDIYQYHIFIFHICRYFILNKNQKILFIFDSVLNKNNLFKFFRNEKYFEGKF